jgi:Ca2+-binding RTX toxin-like protein
MALSVSPGHLGSLLNMTIPGADYTGIAVQSFTTSSTDLATAQLRSISVTDTGPPGPGVIEGVTLRVLAINDTQNTLTFGISLDGQTETINRMTDFVVGYGPDAILVSGLDSNLIAYNLNTNNLPAVNDLVDVISGEAIARGAALTFSATDLGVFDTTRGQLVSATAQTYAGPVAGLREQYINIITDSLNISVATPNWFIHSGSGTDAIAVSAGTNVLDGGTGSNFLTGGSGTDTFFVDDRGPTTADIWSTVAGFHAGDAATVWGVTLKDFDLSWMDGQGAAGFTGLTLHATAAGRPTASLTLAGFTQADMASGRLSVSLGTDPASGSAYVYVHGNS